MWRTKRKWWRVMLCGVSSGPSRASPPSIIEVEEATSNRPAYAPIPKLDLNMVYTIT